MYKGVWRIEIHETHGKLRGNMVNANVWRHGEGCTNTVEGSRNTGPLRGSGVERRGAGRVKTGVPGPERGPQGRARVPGPRF